MLDGFEAKGILGVRKEIFQQFAALLFCNDEWGKRSPLREEGLTGDAKEIGLLFSLLVADPEVQLVELRLARSTDRRIDWRRKVEEEEMDRHLLGDQQTNADRPVIDSIQILDGISIRSAK